MLKKIICLMLLFVSCRPALAANDCILYAARCFQINPLLIKAVIWQESHFDQCAVNINANKTQDIGLMQINSIHLPMLRTMGIKREELQNSACVNLLSGAYILHQQIINHGYSWDTIGRYHSSTPVFHDRYIHSLLMILKNRSLREHLLTLHIPIRQPDKIQQLFSGRCVVPQLTIADTGDMR
ncbi:lytic transglycosylase domain-containing protein [Enterobacter sp. 22466]|uniref:lytic transglycosylase domain-containing protein n=1 Tax=Enterobacter sp. 22466 TaxID=3453924 RepID=UPI003F862B48